MKQLRNVAAISLSMQSDDYIGWLALALDSRPGCAQRRETPVRNSAARTRFSAAHLPLSKPTHLQAAVAQAPAFPAASERCRQGIGSSPGHWLPTAHWDEPEYPSRLREIYDPAAAPLCPRKRGTSEPPLISIAGARRPTPYGNQMAERISKDLADRGLVIASGLASRNRRQRPQRRARRRTGATIGVLGCGIDVVYPKENK